MEDSINTQFKKVIQSLGYSDKEVASYVKTTDVPRKVQAITSGYSFAERKSKVVECLEELKSRNSLLNLLFLRYTMESMVQLNELSIGEIWRLFLRNHAISVLECCLNSNSTEFLNNLVELAIFVQREKGLCPHLLPRILNKYSLINKSIIFTFINLNVDRSALLLPAYPVQRSEIIKTPTCYCTTFLKTVVSDIFELPVIKDELNFLLDGSFQIGRLMDAETLQKSKDKFKDKEVYEALLQNVSLNRGAFSLAVRPPTDGTKTQPARVDAAPEGSPKCLPLLAGSQEAASGAVVLTNPKAGDPDYKLIERHSGNEKQVSATIERVQQNDTINVLKKELEALKFENLSLKHKMTSLERETRSTKGVADARIESGKMPEPARTVEPPDIKSTLSPKSTEAAPVPEPRPTASKTIGLFNKIKSRSADGPAPAQTATPTQPTQAPESTTQPGRFGFGARFGAKEKPIAVTLTSDKSYVGLKWKKTSKAQSQIFSKISYEGCEKRFDLSEFDGFEYKQEKRVAAPVQEMVQRPPSSSLIDGKKSYALNIALGRVKLSNSELIEKILQGEYDNENVIQQLIMYYPTKEELDLIRASTMELGRAELLFKELEDSTRFRSALLALRFKFALKNRSYIEIIRSLTGSFKRILESTELLNLFGGLLVIGNVLNSRSFNGNAEGFSLDSLDMFNTRDILELLRKKVNVQRLVVELTGKTDKPVTLTNPAIATESLIQEISEIKSLYGTFVEGNAKEEYLRTCEAFEEFLGVYKQAKGYFGENDDRFVKKLEDFVRKLDE